VRRFRAAGEKAWSWDSGRERSADSVEGKKRTGARRSTQGTDHGRKGRERICHEEMERDHREKDREQGGALGNAKAKAHGVRRFRPAGDRPWGWDSGGERSADSVEGKKWTAARESRWETGHGRKGGQRICHAEIEQVRWEWDR